MPSYDEVIEFDCTAQTTTQRALTSGEVTDADGSPVADASDVLAVNIPVLITFARSGKLAVVAGSMSYTCPRAFTVVETRLYAATAPTGTTSTPITGQSCVVDINKNGTTLYTTQDNRPTIADGANAQTALTAPDVTALAAGDRLTADIDFVGSTVVGADLTIVVSALTASA